MHPRITCSISRQYMKMSWWSVNMRGLNSKWDKSRQMSIIETCSERSQTKSYWLQTLRRSIGGGMSLIRKTNIKTLSFTKTDSHLQGTVWPVVSLSYRYNPILHNLRLNRLHLTKSPKMLPGSRSPRSKANQSRPDHSTSSYKRRWHHHNSRKEPHSNRIRSHLP